MDTLPLAGAAGHGFAARSDDALTIANGLVPDQPFGMLPFSIAQQGMPQFGIPQFGTSQFAMMQSQDSTARQPTTEFLLNFVFSHHSPPRGHWIGGGTGGRLTNPSITPRAISGNALVDALPMAGAAGYGFAARSDDALTIANGLVPDQPFAVLPFDAPPFGTS